ncbi:hypothetical protein M885DRAFT_540903 [Pelagophyceae sp. CCMP2097]|nr:hypothetical protein M885DRAFT_540903 [Pelagophyceae sp. CCMP2097]
MDDDSEGSQDAAPAAAKRSMGDVLDEQAGRVNARPIEWWGAAGVSGHDLLAQLMAPGVTLITKPQGLRHQSAAQALVEAAPGAYAAARDSDSGICAVHACAFNGYVDALRVLVEAGGADVYAETHDGFDARAVAAERGHANVCEYIDKRASDLEAWALANAPTPEELAAEQARLQRARQAETKRLLLESRLETQKHVEEAKRKMLEDDAARAEEHAEEERQWLEQGVVPARPYRWRGIEIEADVRRNIGYFPGIIRD